MTALLTVEAEADFKLRLTCQTIELHIPSIIQLTSQNTTVT